jgi:hypothetical protein
VVERLESCGGNAGLVRAEGGGFGRGEDLFDMGVLSLIPKVSGANDIRQFRPIALINVIFKFVAKAYAIRLSPIAHRTISLTQSAFIRGRHIHEGILALQEIIHETKSKKLRGVFLKLDFEKAYDRVNWAFLREVLLRKGFEPGWVHRALGLVSGGQTAITINGEVGNFFRNGRGVRQGDPLSPSSLTSWWKPSPPSLTKPERRVILLG